MCLWMFSLDEQLPLTHPVIELSNLFFLRVYFHDTVVSTKEIRIHLCGQGVRHDLPTFCWLNTSMWSTGAHMWEKYLFCCQTCKLKKKISYLWKLNSSTSTSCYNCAHHRLDASNHIMHAFMWKEMECLSISGFRRLCQHIEMCLATHVWHTSWRLIF